MQKINLYAGRYILIIELSNGETVAIPTSKAVALTLPQWAGRVLSVDADGSFRAHWLGNYNINGDFKTELLTFNSNLSNDRASSGVSALPSHTVNDQQKIPLK